MHRLPDGNIPAYMEADTIEGDPDSDLTLTGAAQVRRIDGVIKGDRINYRKDTGEVDVQGNARMMRDGTLVTGPNAKFNVDKYSGEVEKPNFWLGATGGFAVADKADIFSKSQMRLHTVTYSGCSCETPSWYIKANTVDIDFDENEGVARNGVLYFKDVPILASPYMTFPVKKERKSGFLMPTYGTTSKGGFDFSLPYYLNIAPNYDATIQPRYFSKRGLQLGGEFRYLGAGYGGSIYGAYLPNDNVSGEDRWMYWWRHQQLFRQRLLRRLGRGQGLGQRLLSRYFAAGFEPGIHHLSAATRAGGLVLDVLERLCAGLQVPDPAGSGCAVDAAL